MNIGRNWKFHDLLIWLDRVLSKPQEQPRDYAPRRNVPLVDWRPVRRCLKIFLLMIALILLCLLAGCSNRQSAIQPPQHLTSPLKLPTGLIETPREATQYIMEMLVIYEQCEAQKRETVEFYKGLE